MSKSPNKKSKKKALPSKIKEMLLLKKLKMAEKRNNIN